MNCAKKTINKGYANKNSVSDSKKVLSKENNSSRKGSYNLIFILSIVTILLIITGCEENISPIDSTDKNSDVTVPTSDDRLIVTPETKTCPVPLINGRTTVCREGCDYNNLADALKNSENIIITDCGKYNENIKLEKDNVFIDCNNAILDGTGLQTAFDMSSIKAVNIKNCIFNNYNFAISSLDSDNIVIENNKFENNVIAVRIKLGADNIVRSNSFNNNEQSVLIISSNNVLVNKNKIFSSKKNGLELTGASKKCIIDDNEFYSNQESGIKNVAIGNTITNNIFSSNLRYGIECQPGFEASLSGNTCQNNILGGCNGCSGCNEECALKE